MFDVWFRMHPSSEYTKRFLALMSDQTMPEVQFSDSYENLIQSWMQASSLVLARVCESGSGGIEFARFAAAIAAMGKEGMWRDRSSVTQQRREGERG
jgi:hypothetical protein